jgi:hypothetical protein
LLYSFSSWDRSWFFFFLYGGADSALLHDSKNSQRYTLFQTRLIKFGLIALQLSLQNVNK